MSQQSFQTSTERIRQTAQRQFVSEDEKAAWNAVKSGNPLGPWNVTTNSPALTASSAAVAAGSYYDISVAGNAPFSGLNFAQNDPLAKDDQLWKVGNVWFLKEYNSILTPGAVKLNNLSEEVKAATVQTYEMDGREIYPIALDLINNAILFAFEDGTIGGKFDLSTSTIYKASLGADVLQLLLESYDMTGRAQFPIAMDASGKYLLYANPDGSIGGKFALQKEVTDALTVTYDTTGRAQFPLAVDEVGHYLLYVNKDGTIGGKFAMTPGSVTPTMLSAELQAQLVSPAFKRLNAPNPTDVAFGYDESRNVQVEIPARTSLTGYGFSPFPDTYARRLTGINTTGTTLEVRLSNRLPVRGKRFRQTFNPTSSGVVGANFVGYYGNGYTNSYPAFPAGNTGDCWLIDAGNVAATKTANGLTFKSGDYLVKTAGGYAIQPGPGDGSSQFGDFWNVTASGIFGGMNLVAGQRLLITGYRSNGGPRHVVYQVGQAGDYFLMGECYPAMFTPAEARNGDLYIVGATGSAQGVALQTGDSLVYQGGWGRIPGSVQTIAAGAFFYLACAESASEWEIRRADKSGATVDLIAFTSRASLIQRILDAVLLLSDSMFGANVGYAIQQLLTGRIVAIESYGGGTSDEILSMYDKITRSGDPYAAWFITFWHGQNNQTDVLQIKAASLRFASLIGSKQGRFCIWSVLGQRVTSFDGNRLVLDLLEGAKAGTNHLAEIERWTKATFPKQSFFPRQALLTVAAQFTNVPDLQFPGKTVAQTAVLYGAIPLPFFLDYTTLPIPAAQWSFKGYQSAAGLPSGGVHGDYYLRTGNGEIGNFLLNVNGAWQEISFDRTHLNGAGGQGLGTSYVTTYLIPNNL
jgi:hypothetical protein